MAENIDPLAAAASWLILQNPVPSPIIPELRRRFGLTNLQAIDAVRHAGLQKARAT